MNEYNNPSCELCRFLITFPVSSGYVYRCSHPAHKAKAIKYGRLIGGGTKTPEWCPIGKATGKPKLRKVKP